MFKREAMTVFVKTLKKKDLLKLKSIFNELDQDHTGMITAKDIKKALRKIGQKGSAKEIQKIMNNVDSLGDGKIHYSEFLAATINVKDLLTDEHIVTLFDYFDTDNTGYISRENLKEAFKKAGKPLSEEDLDEIMENHDYQKNGRIEFREFRQMMLENIEFDLSQD